MALCHFWHFFQLLINPIALRTAKPLWSFGCSECYRVKEMFLMCIHMSFEHVLFRLFRVKCPYCPVEQSPDDAKVVVF